VPWRHARRAGTGTALPGYVASTVCNTTLPKQTGSNAGLKPENRKASRWAW
jgi:iron complex outermembrane receptor protein